MESKKKKIIIRKRIPANSNSVKETPKKTVKIAKKLPNKDPYSPLPNTIQEDLMLESEEFPVKFLQFCHSKPEFELISQEKVLKKKKTTLSPTEVIGSYKSFQQKAKIDDMALEKKFTKFHLAFRRMITKKPSMDLDEKIKIQKNSINYSDFDEFSPKINTPGAKIAFEKQEKSLKMFEKQQKYWQNIEAEISEKINKDPEKLSFNSWKNFMLKREKIENNEFLEKIDKKNERPNWKFTLREEDFLRNNPNVSPRYIKSAQAASRLQKEIIKYTKTPDYQMIREQFSPCIESRTGRDRLYEIKAMKNHEDFEKSIKEDVHDLKIEGRNKISLEYWAAKKIGAKYVKFNKPEPMNEQIIDCNYDPKVLY